MEFEISSRSRLVALLLCFFFGVFGAHRFYLGRIPSAIAMLLTLGGLGIWATIDFILIAAGALRDGDGRRVYRWTEPPPVSV